MHSNCRCHKAWLFDRSALLGDSVKREENFLDTILFLLASNFHFPLPRQLVGMPSKCQLRSGSVIVGTTMRPNLQHQYLARLRKAMARFASVRGIQSYHLAGEPDVGFNVNV
jgi:hypothetical protein